MTMEYMLGSGGKERNKQTLQPSLSVDYRISVAKCFDRVLLGLLLRLLGLLSKVGFLLPMPFLLFLLPI